MNGLFRLFNRKSTFANDEICLVLSREDVSDAECGIVDGYLFRIYHMQTRDYIGYVSLRLGESPALYYLGHIGYRIEEEHRGHGYAQMACTLMKPLLLKLSLHDVVITTDEDNIASRKTCENLGCVLERIAPVPAMYRYICSGSVSKCRYIWQVSSHPKTK